MSSEIVREDRVRTNHLHPRIYWALAGLAAWFVLSAWSFAGRGYYIYLTLAMVSVLVLIATTIPYLLARIWRRDRRVDVPEPSKRSFREWVASEFDIWQGHVGASTAAVEILIPIVAVAFGMTAFSIVMHLAVHTAGYVPPAG
ncbi:MAG TPA: hypothetical protein VMU42_07450 [Candidatus Sulfotelmatobacter sp.]|nr:hypothetical protein [Candidatus Sulfotelmatobacter sp.]